MSELIQLDRKRTNFNSSFLEEYLYTNNLDDLVDFELNAKGLKDALKYRKLFAQEKRDALHKVLYEQYASSGIEINDTVRANIEALRSPNTFTITTGQQIHVGLGPLYVWYKILTAIACAKQASEQNPDIKVVPVFWMATEDHDLEEIQDVKLFGKEFRWDTSQTGPVGRMSTEGISKVFDEICEELNLKTSQEEFISLANKAYENRSLADATRILIHEQFKDLGLVVLDADNQHLKSYFTQAIISEMRGEHQQALEHSSSQLANKGHEEQIYIRDLNLFYLGKERVRIIKKDNDFYAGDKLLCSVEDLEGFVGSNCYNISPNVALRPLYQEIILPNLAYVGGPSELKYWMQLGGLIHKHDLKMPLLVLRNSWVIIPEKVHKKLNISDLYELYSSEGQLIEKYAGKVQEVKDETFMHLKQAIEELREFGQKVENNVPGFSLSGKINKIYPKMKELEGLAVSRFSELAQNNPDFNKIKRAQSQFFSGTEPQERSRHIIEFVGILPELKERLTFNNLDNLLRINHLVTKTI